MKAIDSIRNKITKVSVSTVLFWLGCFVAVLAAGLQWKIPSNQLVLFLATVGGVVLAGSQKIVGDREQRQQLEQERNRSDEKAQDYARRGSELRLLSNLKPRYETMPHKDTQIIQRRTDATE